MTPGPVFLDANQVIKLGDFGLSKALGAASFAHTYVGVSDIHRLANAHH
jgi:serine/threonine-protein kinase Nek2